MTRANRIGLRQESGQSVCPWPPKPWCSGAPIVGELVIERKFVTTPTSSIYTAAPKPAAAPSGNTHVQAREARIEAAAGHLGTERQDSTIGTTLSCTRNYAQSGSSATEAPDVANLE
jgi:hypothetical protein